MLLFMLLSLPFSCWVIMLSLLYVRGKNRRTIVSLQEEGEQLSLQEEKEMNVFYKKKNKNNKVVIVALHEKEYFANLSLYLLLLCQQNDNNSSHHPHSYMLIK